MAKKPSKPAPYDTSPAELGPIAAATKKKVSPKRWSNLVKSAHKRGFSVNSYLDQTVPAPLKERTRESLSKQATSTINAAYAPAQLELTQQETKIKSLADKRKRDNEYYASWLATKNADIQSASAASTAHLQAGIQELHAKTAAAYGQQPATLQAEASRVPGTVSDMGESKALTLDIDAQKLHALSLLGNQGQANMTTAALGDKAIQATSANSFAFLAAQAAKQSAASFDELSKVGDAKQKLVLDKASASSKEVARLLDQEIEKSAQNRNFAVAADKLGVDVAQLNQKAQNDAATLTARATQNAATNSLAAARLEETRRANAAREEAAAIRLGISQQNTDISYYNSRHPGKGKGGKGKTPVNPQERFDYAYAQLRGGQNPAAGDAPFTVEYVKKNRAVIQARLQTSAKISPEMARRVVAAFIATNRGDAGSYKDYDGVTPVHPNP